MKWAFCIAGTHSGCGKTTVALGIMSALVRRGLRVQAFKVGPDFIDPGHHRRITGRDSHNLDGWMMGLNYSGEVFTRYGSQADAAVVEGVMGLYDGSSACSQEGSTAEMAKHLGIPVVLVVDAGAMARSAAAVVKGFEALDPEVPLKGVVFNRVGSPSHAGYLREAMSCELPHISVLGCLPKDEALVIPSRHLGLFTDEDHPLGADTAAALAAWVEGGMDLDQVLEQTHVPEGWGVSWMGPKAVPLGARVKIGIAMDRAFSFHYPENLRLLREAGAELVPFSPLEDPALPHGIQGLIFWGGYPELYCEALERNLSLRRQIRAFARSGGPIYAECGGFMFLTEGIQEARGREHSMVGVFPVKTVMQSGLRTLGYREVVTTMDSPLGPAGIRVRGHEFHYSDLAGEAGGVERIYRVRHRNEDKGRVEGFLVGRSLGSYIHLHWGSNPRVPVNFVNLCRETGIGTIQD